MPEQIENQEDNQEQKPTETPDATPEEKPDESKGFFKNLFKKLTAKPTEDEQQPDDSEQNQEQQDEELEVEERLVTAGRKAGWSDDKIAKYAKEDPDVLEALAKMSPAEEKKPVENPAEKPAEKKSVMEKISFDKGKIDAIKEQYGSEVVDQLVLPLVDKLNNLIDVVDAQSGKVQNAEDAVNGIAVAEKENRFQAKLDELGSKHTVFGKWENVPLKDDGSVDTSSPAFKARAEVWMSTEIFEKAGMPFDKALDNAIALYKGRNLENDIRADIVAELSKNKTTFTPRPTSKKTKPIHTNERQQAVAEFKDAAAKAGITFDE